jgi:hypothetical protein
MCWPGFPCDLFPPDTLLREGCENVEPIVSRDEATEHSSPVVFQHCCPLQLFSLRRYLGHVRSKVHVRGDTTC